MRGSVLSCAIVSLAVLLLTSLTTNSRADNTTDLSSATVVVRSGREVPVPEVTAAEILVQETQKRTGLHLKVTDTWPESGAVIALYSGQENKLHGVTAPEAAHATAPEGYALATDTTNSKRPVVWIVGADPRGVIYGVGKLLRAAEWRPGSLRLSAPLNVTSAPEKPIRGHQLGYRATANSYDAWSPAQFEQYIRDLALFGSNSVEGIPFQDDRPTVSSYPRSKMNVDLSRICAKYGQAYWLWVPADFDLNKKDLRQKALDKHAELFAQSPELTGIFVAGGDPGDNHPKLVIPYLADLAKLLVVHHPKARVWLSMQGYDLEQQQYVYDWINRGRPTWFGGIVAGPSSPPIAELRANLPEGMPIRDYPDITHSVRSQFPVPYWDPAFCFTLGRECVNPRPNFFSRVIHDTGPFTSGFISYSDGCHDDFNKVLWSSLAWDSKQDLNTIATDYTRLFFGPDVADDAAAGIFQFERDWMGALKDNGGVDANFALWKSLEARSPQLKNNWRWQLYLLRAYYDMSVRKRLAYETQLEEDANGVLATSSRIGSETASARALATLAKADTSPARPELAAKAAQLCDDLFHSIGLQTSVAKYGASGSERGCVLDFLNYPLNNRYWLEDEIAKARKLPTEETRVARLKELATWEHPGPGSYYDSLGNVAKSPHEVRAEQIVGPLLDVDNLNLPGAMFWTGNDPKARARQSWFTSEAWPTAVRYPYVDKNADYTIRVTGMGDVLLKVNGIRIQPKVDGRNLGEIKEFPVNRLLYRDGQITVTFDPTFEPTLNWRVQSRITEIWLLKK